MSRAVLKAVYFCYDKAAWVILAWVALACVGLATVLLLLRIESGSSRIFLDETPAAQTLTKFSIEFPDIDSLTTVQITGKTPDSMRKARNEILLLLRGQRTVFRQVFSPGAGDYYDEYQVYHLSEETVASRVDYALAVKPLLDVLAKSRSLANLSKTIQNIAASPDLGKHANVYEDLLRKIAAAAEGAASGKSAPVDWLSFAGLRLVNEPKLATLLVWPLPSEHRKAIDTLTEQGERQFDDVEVEILGMPLYDGTKPSDISTLRLAALGLIALILVVLVLLVLSGDLGFATIVTLCWLVTVSAAAPIVLFAGPLHVPLLPFYVAALLFALTTVVGSMSALSYAAIAEPHPADFLEGYTTQELPRRVNIVLVLAAALLGCFIYADRGLLEQFFIVLGTAAVSCIACASLLPAVFRFADPAAQSRLMFRTNSKPPAPLLLIVMALLCYGCLFLLMPQVRQQEDQPVSSARSLSVLAQDAESAERLTAQIKTIPAAARARWLGDFLPQDTTAKQKKLQQIEVDLPEQDVSAYTSPDNSAALQDIANSLNRISKAETSTPELRSVALAGVKATLNLTERNDATQMRDFEKDLFSGLAKFTSEARALVGLVPPRLDQLDPLLQSMFVSRQGTYRIEVEPASGKTLNGLALALRANGIVAASPFLVQMDQRAAVLRGAFVLLGIGVLGAAPLLFVARLRLTAAVQALCAISFVTAAVLSALAATRTEVTEPLLLLALPAFALLWSQVATSNVASRLGLVPLHGVNMQRELEWLVPLVLIGAAFAAIVVNLFDIAQILGFAATLALLLVVIMELLAINVWRRN